MILDKVYQMQKEPNTKADKNTYWFFSRFARLKIKSILSRAYLPNKKIREMKVLNKKIKFLQNLLQPIMHEVLSIQASYYY